MRMFYIAAVELRDWSDLSILTMVQWLYCTILFCNHYAKKTVAISSVNYFFLCLVRIVTVKHTVCGFLVNPLPKVFQLYFYACVKHELKKNHEHKLKSLALI